MNNLGLDESVTEKICEVFKNNKKVLRAAVFGSRAKGNYKKYSDIDIAVWGEFDRLDAQRIESELEDLPLIYKFDVADYDKIKSAELKEHIDRVGIIIYARGET